MNDWEEESTCAADRERVRRWLKADPPTRVRKCALESRG